MSQLAVILNTTDFNLIWLFIGNQGSMYTPLYEVTYGNVLKTLRMPESYTSMLQSIQLKRVYWKLVNNDNRPCQEDVTGKESLVECIDKYIEKQVGCSSKFQPSHKNLELCTTESQYKQWAKVSGGIVTLGENEIYNLTGCLGPCEMFDYGETVVQEMQPDPRKDLALGEKSLNLHVYFDSGRHEAREEYYVYDDNSLIADVGGYLGLLLGHSAFSLFCGMKELVHKAKSLLK